uniref:VM domain-containing protein n=1 Tax=Glossina austeni TaxID=7395 RepID=A0A1A9UJ58_GLOAU
MFYNFMIMLFISVFCSSSEASIIQNHGVMVAPSASTYNAHTIEHAIAYPLLLQATPASTTLFAFPKHTTPSLIPVSPPTPPYNQIISLTTASIGNIISGENSPKSMTAPSSSFHRPPGIGFLALTYAAPAFGSFLYDF